VIVAELYPSEVNDTRFILAMSGKGGVGKSTVAARLAVALATKYKVGLLDVDITTPSIPKLLGLEGKKMLAKNLIHPVPVGDNLLVYSIGLDAPPEQFIAFRGDLSAALIEEAVFATAWGNPDFIVLDMPPTTGDELIKVLEILDGNGKALLVTMPTAVSKTDVVRTINMLKHHEVPILGVIENMSGVFPGNGGQEISDEYEIPLVAKIQFSEHISQTNDTGYVSAETPQEPFPEIVEFIEGEW
jgi:ATP-binding protein involved in chromosome partitioning